MIWLILQHKADYTLKYTPEEIQTYLETRLMIEAKEYPAFAAEGRSVTLASSKRAGLGEYLFIYIGWLKGA